MASMFCAPSSFAFHPNESIERGFVRVLGQLALQARRLTQHADGKISESVHDTRVLIKWLRALLWFAGPAFSTSEMNRAKSHLRRASHLLAAQRELEVMQSMLKRLSQKTENPAYRKALAQIAKAEDSQQASTKRSGQSLRQAVRILLGTIKHFEQRVKTRSKWPSCPKRVAQAFLAVQKSGKKALKSDNAAQFHNWRKKAKRLLYQLQLTQAVSGKHMTRTIEQVDKLQQELGDYHDCVIAQDRLHNGLDVEVSSVVVKRTVKLLELRKDRLRKRARKIGRQIKLK
jgi:CHAD domain-containing protein